MSITDTAADMVLADLDPRTLKIDKNVRTKLGDITALTASVREYGVLIPLIVLKENGHHRVVAGARRATAAVKANRPTVPCLIRTGINGDQALLEAQMIENLAREALTTADEAKGYKQLAAFGLDEKAIATLTSRPVAAVNAGLTVAASAPTLKAAAKHDLTLDQSAVLAEFTDDKKSFDELLRVAVEDPADWDWTVEELRADAVRERKLADVRAKLEQEGCATVDKRPGFDPGVVNCRLSELADAKGKSFTVKSHQGCPGHAAYVEDQSHLDPKVIYLCKDPAGNEHTKSTEARAAGPGRSSSPVEDTRTPEQKEADSAERREVLAGNKAWRIAEPVRLKFVTELCSRKTAPKGMLRFVTEEVLGNPHALHSNSDNGDDGRFADLLGVDRATVKPGAAGHNGFGVYGRATAPREAKAATDARLPILLFAAIAAVREGTMDTHTWRPISGTTKSAAKRYLDFLASCGYKLSDIERKVQ